MFQPVLRLAYILEFLLAMLTVSAIWSQVGGQGHLDLMPWYDKLVLIVSFSLVTVLGTAAAVNRERAWNRVSMICLVAAVIIACGMGIVTYYYHLHEEEDITESDSGVALLGERAMQGRFT